MWPFRKKEEMNDRNLGLEANPEPENQPVSESYDRLGDSAPKFEPSMQPQQNLQQFSQNTDLQLISAKLDTLKAMIETLSQRLALLEKNVEEKSEKKQKLW